MILARYGVERYASRGQDRTDAHLVLVPEGGPVLAYHVFAKPRPLLDAQDAANRTGCCTDGPANNRPERSSRSVACGCTLLGSADGSLCMRGERQTHQDEGGNWKEFDLHDRSSYLTTTRNIDMRRNVIALTQNAAGCRRGEKCIAGLR